MADAPRRKAKTKAVAERGRRDTILAAAVESVIEDGYARTTMSQVARRARVPRPLVQYYFPTLALLLRAAIEAIVEGWRSQYYDRIIASAEGSIGIVQGVDDRWTLMHQPLYRAYHELLAAARTDTSLAAIMAELDSTRAAAQRDAALRAFSNYVAADAEAFDDTSVFTAIFLDGLLLHEFGADDRPAMTERQLTLLKRMLARYWADHGLPGAETGTAAPPPATRDLTDLAQQLIDKLRPLADTNRRD